MNSPFDIPLPPDEPLVAPGSMPDLDVIAELPQEQTKVAPQAAPANSPGFAALGPLRVAKPLDNPLNIVPGPETAPVGDVVTTQVAPPVDPDIFSSEGLQINYRGRKDVPYGRSATANARPFTGLVVHHTGIDNAETSITYGHAVDNARGGSFGYHFYIAKDGTISQGAPLTSRTNHIKDPGQGERVKAHDLANNNSIGISMVGMGNDHTPAQIEAAAKLGQALQKRFGIQPSQVFGHGELQKDRQGTEGMAVVSRLRSGLPVTLDHSSRIEPALNAAIARASKELGVSAQYLQVSSLIESAGGYNKKTSSAGAEGPFQFLGPAWRDHGQGGNPKDVNDAALAAARLALANSQGLSKVLGRVPTDAELYLAHQQGLTGATKLLSNPDAPASSAVGSAAVTGNGGKLTMTAGQFATMIKDKYSSIAATGSATFTRGMDPTRPATQVDLTAAPRPPVAGKWNEATAEAQRLAHNQDHAGFFDALGHHMGDNLTGRLLADKSMIPVPGHVSDLKALTEGVPEHYWGRFSKSVSPEHDLMIREGIAKHMDMTEKLQAIPGKSGTAAVLAALIDPAAWAAGSAAGGAGGLVANMARLGATGTRIAGAVSGAAGNMGADALSQAQIGEEASAHELAISGLLGAGFGFAFGPLGRNPALAREAVELEAIANRHAALVSREMASGVSSEGLQPGMITTSLPEALAQSDVAMGRLGSIRYSEGGRGANSDNPWTRLISGSLGVDTVGKGALVNQSSADQIADRLTKRDFASWRSVAMPQYERWADEKGISKVRRMAGSGWDDYQNEVGSYIRSTDPNKSQLFHPAVVSAGEQAKKIYAQRAADLNNPLRESGITGRSVFGAEGLLENENYLNRVYSPAKMAQLLETHGEAQLSRLITGAMLRSSPEMAEEVANKISLHILRSPRMRAMGMDEHLDAMFHAKDLAPFKEFMEKELGLAKSQIDDLMEMVGRNDTAKPGAKSADLANLKKRLGMDETFSMHLEDGSELRLTDLLENNVDNLMHDYLRRTSGRIAMAQNRVYHPETGKLLLDGITSDAEFDHLVKKAQEWAITNKVDPAVIKREVEGMEWMRDRILGRPDPDALGETAAWLRLARTFNFSRLMGQMGFAQVMDSGAIIGAVGIKSYVQHMGAYHRILNMDGKTMLAHGLDRELESMLGLGTDALRQFQALTMEGALHMRAYPGTGKRAAFLNGAQTVMDGASQGVTMMSGMNAVNSWLQLSFGRAAAQKFANIAHTGKVSKSDRNLLNFLGLRPEMEDRIFSQVNKHFSTKDGALFGRKVTQMNLDRWDDLEASTAFQNALYRWSRHVVQENDVGAMHRVMSKPLAQTMLQFRSYALTAWENQMLHRTANFNGRNFATMAWSTITGSLVYAAQTNIQSIGRSDQEAFLKSKGFGPELDFKKLGLATFQRSGWSSIVPMLIDSGGMLTGMGPLFDARTSGQATDILFGNPTFGLLDDIGKAAKGIGRELTGSGATQSDARNIGRLFPLQNSIPLANIYSSLISDRSAPQLR